MWVHYIIKCPLVSLSRWRHFDKLNDQCLSGSLDQKLVFDLFTGDTTRERCDVEVLDCGWERNLVRHSKLQNVSIDDLCGCSQREGICINSAINRI